MFKQSMSHCLFVFILACRLLLYMEILFNSTINPAKSSELSSLRMSREYLRNAGKSQMGNHNACLISKLGSPVTQHSLLGKHA